MANLTRMPPREPLKPSTGAAVRNHRNAVRNGSERCPQLIGIPVRFRRNPHAVVMTCPDPEMGGFSTFMREDLVAVTKKKPFAMERDLLFQKCCIKGSLLLDKRSDCG